MTTTKQLFVGLVTALILSVPAMSAADNHGSDRKRDRDRSGPEQALIILTSESLQTRAMAMVLGTTMQEQGTDIHILLCDSAGELAVSAHESPTLEPRGATPEGLMKGMMDNGASVDVCALFLPNSDYAQEDLIEGVGSAKPPEIAEMMTSRGVRVFSF